jgi:hypothetical protein
MEIFLIELEEYSPESHLKNKVFINKFHISELKQSGIYTTITLYCGKEVRVSENAGHIARLCGLKQSDK